MNIKEYSDVLKFAIQLQINYQKEEMEEAKSYEEERYYDGIITGLRIALGKIDKSMFLAENQAN